MMILKCQETSFDGAFCYTKRGGEVGMEGEVRGRGEGGGAHQPRKRTLVPGGWKGRLLRRRRVEGRGWLE